MGRKGKSPQKTDFIKWLLILGLVAVAAVVLLYASYRYHWFQPDLVIDRAKYPVRGIDVSNHNDSVDFELVVNDGYDFVFIKASEGATYRDPMFEHNVRAAADAGLCVGAYHFFRQNRTAAEQIQNFLAAVGDTRLDLPLVIDVEDEWGNAGDDPTVTMKRLAGMVHTLRDMGHKVMVYTNGNGYRKYYKKHLDHDCLLWLCSFKHPDSLTHLPHVVQQYSHWGKVKGVDGDVDLNVFCGSRKEWQEFLKQNQQEQ